MYRKPCIKGIPTAISYDIVRVGNTYGSVFELLHAKSFNDWVIEYEDCPEKLDELIQLYVSCLKQVHETELDKSDLPFARDEMLEKVAALQAYLPQDVQQRLRDLLAALPDDFWNFILVRQQSCRKSRQKSSCLPIFAFCILSSLRICRTVSWANCA